MVVSDLIERLQKFDPTLEVVLVSRQGSKTAYFVDGVELNYYDFLGKKIAEGGSEEVGLVAVIFGDKS